MNPDETPNDPAADDGDVANHVADRNVERLLADAYRPVVPDPAFVQQATAAMHAAAAQRPATPVAGQFPGVARRLAAWTVAATLLVGVGVILGSALRGGPEPRVEEVGGALPGPAELGGVRLTAAVSEDSVGSTGLTARVRGESPPVETLAVGDSLKTTSDQRRRVALEDGSVLYLNRDTELKVDRQRHVTLLRGEIFVEVSSRHPADETGGPPPPKFVVATPGREITALGTKFDVRLEDEGTSVTVIQGKVRVAGMKLPVLAGQQLAPEGRPQLEALPPIIAAPRATHVIDWTKDLMAKVESPLVPQSKYSGGALIALDPHGQEAKLSLRKYHVDVHIEDGFARTTIDQTYFNHLTSRLEGTFYFPLPPDASLSRLAMYVNGKLMEGGMAEREHARATFEDIVRRMKDPALLEWIDGSTFKMRVFPLEGRQEKRIVLSYTQKLPSLYRQTEYRFPGGHNMQQVGRWSVHVRVKDGARLRWESDSHDFKTSKRQGDLVLEASAEKIKPDQDVVLTLREKRKREQSPSEMGQARFNSAVHEGSKYLMLRWRPELPTKERHERRDWVFLFEASADRDPVLARVQVDVIKTLLENAEHEDTFSIITAGTRVHGFAAKPQAATPKNVKRAVKFLERTHLVGALDLGRGLQAAGPLVKAAKNPYLVHVGSGLPILGTKDIDALVRRIPDGARYVGVGVGKRWSRTLMKMAAGRTGGCFTQINPDEQVNWRALDLLSTLNTPRLLGIQVVDDAKDLTFLCHNDMLAQGEELCAIAQFDEDAEVPGSVEVTGTIDGKPYSENIPVADVTEGADYLPRTWAKLEIDRLVALGAVENKGPIIELSKAMYVMSPFTSLLVLENEEMYRKYKIDRGRKDHWALYPCPEEIPVVHEPLTAGVVRTPAEQAAGKRPSAAEILRTVIVRVPPQILQWPGRPSRQRSLAVPVVHFFNGRSGNLVRNWGGMGGFGGGVGGGWWYDANGDGRHDNLFFRGMGGMGGMGMPVYNWETVTTSGGELGGRTIPLGNVTGHFVPWTTGDGLSSVTFSPNGRMLTLAGRDGTFRLWDVTSGTDVNGWIDGRFLPGTGAYSNDGSASYRTFGSLGWDGKLNHRDPFLWDLTPIVQHGATQAGLLPITGDPVVDRRKVSELMQRFESLMETGRYRFAEEAGTAEALRRYGSALRLRSDGYLRDALSLRVARQKGVIDTLYQIELSHVPFPNEPPIVYPDAEVWQALTARRSEKYGWLSTRVYPVADLVLPIGAERYESMSLASRGPAERKIDEALNSPTQLEFINTPLEDVFEYLKDYHAIEIQIDSRALHDVGIGTDTPITRKLSGISLRSALRLLLRELNLTYLIQDEVLLITTPEEVASSLTNTEFTVARSSHRMKSGQGLQWLSYQQPSFQNNWAVYHDLLGYAPGMNTSLADVCAILEAEVQADPAAGTGKIDEVARRLIEKARGARWQTATIRSKKGKLLLSVDFDGTGRCRYERTTASGLREQTVSDGTNLWQLYGELGIGARRHLSRFHRRHVAGLVPWVLPPAEELARGADLKALDKQTVAIVPQAVEEAKDEDGKPRNYARVHMLFDPDGRLAERRLVEMPSSKVLLRQTYAADGSIRWLDADDKVLLERKIDLEPCGAPDLKPDAEKLAILPMPLRTRNHVGSVNGCEQWSEDDALAKISSALATNPWAVTQIIARRFFSRDDRRLGFYTLMIANGYTWNPNEERAVDKVRVTCNPVVDHPDEPLANFVAKYLMIRLEDEQREFGTIGGPGDGFLQRLAEFRDLWILASSGRATQGKETDRRQYRDRALKFIRRGKSPEFAWALWTVLRDQGGDQRFHREMAEAAKAFENVPGMAYVARYERARAMGNSGDWQQAGKLFEKLYAETIEAGFLPPIDSSFRQAFQHGGGGNTKWRALMEKSSAKLIADGARTAAIRLAWQVHHAGDQPLAEELFNRAQGGVAAGEHLPTTLAAVEYLWHSGQQPRADGLLQPLLDNEKYAKWPALWRLAALIAEKRGMTARALGYTQRAMEIEYEHLPEVVNVQAIRSQYSGLLEKYRQLAAAVATLHAEPPRELLGRVIRVADRWRSLDTDPTAACHAAARIFGDLGAADLAWDYLTTPLAAKPNEAAPWRDLAEMLRQQAQFDLADRAYALAFETEPQNAQILWDRAQVLLQAGQAEAAKELFGQLAEGQWQPRFDWLKSQAKQYTRAH